MEYSAQGRTISPQGLDLRTFDKDFIMELFLDSDSVSTMNRLVVAMTNVVHDNIENLNMYNEVFKEEFNGIKEHKQIPAVLPMSQKLIGYYEDFNILHNYEDNDYIERYKMKRSTVEALINYLKELHIPTSSNIPLEKKVYIFLWLLTSDCSYNEVGLVFGLTKSSVSYIFHEMSALLADQRYHFINWPSVEEQHITRIKVNSRFNFPNCVGFIDTCRLYIGSKRRKKQNLVVILLQAVCDENLMFIDIHIGPRGETKKSRVFKDSSLSQELKNFVDYENHLLGDSEYKLKNNLMTPFSSEELLTSEEMKFNEVHWRARNYIGNAFEKLKERFKKLSHIDINKTESVNSLITAACVLHNFIIIHEGCSEIKEEIVVCDDGITIDTNIVKTTAEKRQFLCNYINYIDSESNSLSPGSACV